MTTLLAAVLRRLAAASAVALTGTALGAVWLAGPAAADVPTGWSDPDPVDPLFVVLVAGGIPLLGVLLLAAMLYGPPLARGEQLIQYGPRPDAQWLGGPKPAAELPAADEDLPDPGGASGRW